MRRAYYAYIFVPVALTGLWMALYLPWKTHQPPPRRASYEAMRAIWVPPRESAEEIAHRKRMQELRDELRRVEREEWEFLAAPSGGAVPRSAAYFPVSPVETRAVSGNPSPAEERR